MRALRRLRDAMTPCASCGQTNFLDDPASSCRVCGRPLLPAYLLSVGRHRLPVSVFTEVRADHLPGSSAVEGQTLLAAVRRHPQDSNRLGLHNRSPRTWTATLADGRVFRVEPDQTVDLLPGLSVDLQPGRLSVLDPRDTRTLRA